MTELGRQLRGLYARSLMIVLFPFVLLLTLYEEIPTDWREGFAIGFVATPILTLGMLAVIGVMRGL
jgi:hypothetical protein